MYYKPPWVPGFSQESSHDDRFGSWFLNASEGWTSMVSKNSCLSPRQQSSTCLCGFNHGLLWFTYDLPMIYHDLPMNYLWFTYDLPMIYLWFTYELPMIYLWFTYDLPMIYLWITYDLPMIYLWFYHDLPTKLWIHRKTGTQPRFVEAPTSAVTTTDWHGVNRKTRPIKYPLHTACLKIGHRNLMVCHQLPNF